MDIWKAYDQKLEKTLIVNQKLMEEVTKLKVNGILTKTGKTKKIMLLIGIPYLLLLYGLVIIGYLSGGIFFTIGFGAIASIMTVVVLSYRYHLYLIDKIDRSDCVLDVQESLSRLKLSSFKITRLAFLQIPFWFICWVSFDALKNSLAIYGSINLLVFLGSTYLTFWIYTNLSIDKMDNKLNKLVFTGYEWDPIIKASSLLQQIEEYKQ